MQAICTPTSTGDGDARARAWGFFSRTVYRLIPSPAYRVRRGALRLFGATLDGTSRIRGGVEISAPWNLKMGRKSSIGEGAIIWSHAPIEIGDRSVISQYCFVSCAAWIDLDPRRGEAPSPLKIGDDVWIAAETVVMGGQTIPNGVLIGARSLVSSELKPWMIATGHPAQSRRDRDYKGAKS